MRKGNHELVKTLNKSMLIQLLQRHERLSRAEIAEMTRLSPSTVTVLSEELLQDGLIQECGTAESSGGRKPILLELNPHGGYIIGIDLGGSVTRAGLVNLQGEVEVLVEEELARDDGPVVVSDIIALTRRLASQVDPPKLMGIGVAVPGLLDTSAGTVVLSSLLQWHHVPLEAALNQEFPTRVALLNDANAAAIAEHRYGLGRGVEYLLYVTAGRGVGSGLVLGDSLYTGPRGMAGELGHMTMDLNGPECRCGNRGCLGAMAGGRYQALRARQAIARGRQSLMPELAGGDPNAIETPHLVKAAALGDPLAVELVRQSGEYIGAGVASLINLVNPQKVIVGGSMVHEGSILLQTIQQVVPARVLSVHREVPVVQTSLGEDGKLIGAATLVLEHLFRPVQFVQ